jgi:hypothetical protein
MGLTFWVLTLEGRNLWGFPRVSGLPGVSRVFPDMPGLRVVTTLFCVRGYTSPLHTFGLSYLSLSLSLSCPFRPATLRTHSFTLFTPLGLGLVRFVGIIRRDCEQELGEC